jgi:hypothetical protein
VKVSFLIEEGWVRPGQPPSHREQLKAGIAGTDMIGKRQGPVLMRACNNCAIMPPINCAR